MTASGVFPPRACGVCCRPEGGEVEIAFGSGPNGLCVDCALDGVMAFGAAGIFPFKKMLERVPDVRLERRLEQLEKVVPRTPEDAACVTREVAVIREHLREQYLLRKD